MLEDTQDREEIIERVAALDIGKAEVVVCVRVPSPTQPGRRAQEIATFCKLTYDVTFPMFEKVVTRKGTAQSPIYTFLGSAGKLPAWNFSKYVVDKQGKVVAFFESSVTPEDPALRAAIAKALASS